MLTRSWFESVALCSLLACSSAKNAAPVQVTLAKAPPAPAPAVARAEAPAEPAAPAPATVPVMPALPVPEGPPRRALKGPGISITETSDGRVILKTTATWGEAIDTTYSDCSFYLAAVPVLTGQLSLARAKLLPRVCPSTAGAAGKTKH